MEFAIATWVFYLFAALVLGSALMVISARNSVHAVLFLILAFFNSAALFVLLGAEYIAMTLVIVYVGAVAVLFLFVVMMLDVDFAALKQGFLRYLPIGSGVAILLLIELWLVFSVSFVSKQETAPARHPIPPSDVVSNTEAIGNVLYSDYVYPFQLAGIILLVAMIGAIVLTHRVRPGVRRQVIGDQVSRKREDSIALVKVKPGEGA